MGPDEGDGHKRPPEWDGQWLCTVVFSSQPPQTRRHRLGQSVYLEDNSSWGGRSRGRCSSCPHTSGALWGVCNVATRPREALEPQNEQTPAANQGFTGRNTPRSIPRRNPFSKAAGRQSPALRHSRWAGRGQIWGARWLFGGYQHVSACSIVGGCCCSAGNGLGRVEAGPHTQILSASTWRDFGDAKKPKSCCFFGGVRAGGDMLSRVRRHWWQREKV